MGPADAMRYVKLGSTGLDVSAICIGCLSFGEPKRGEPSWTLDEQSSRPLIRAALDAGVNFFDTANCYSAGSSEEILGRAIADFARREEVVIATKVYARMRPGANGMGLSRKVILTEVDASLRRLRTDYIDLYQIHRWDTGTPIEETIEVLHDVIRSGKVRYIGASSMQAWQFSKALHVAERHGWTRFAAMQNLYNLLYREEEREMIPLCIDQQIGVLPWSPLARGRLARPAGSTSPRQGLDEFGSRLPGPMDQEIIDQVGAIASARGVTRAQVALAWVASKPFVTAPIVGLTRREQLDDALASLSIDLSDTEQALMEAPYRPREPIQFDEE